MRPHKSKTNILVIFYVVLASVLLFQSIRQIHVIERNSEARKKSNVALLANISIQAKAAYVLDIADGHVLYKKNEHVPLPIASITKIASALCALPKLGGESTVIISSTDVNKFENDLFVGDTWRVKDLVAYMLIGSSNSAARALARSFGGEAALVACMNKKANELRLYDTKFANATGLDIEGKPGAYGSAKDVANLLIAGMRALPEIFEKTGYKSYNVSSVNGRVYDALNTDIAIENIPSLIASKTGFTALAGGNLVFAMNAGLNHKIIVAILGSTKEGRFTDAVTLSQTITKVLAQ